MLLCRLLTVPALALRATAATAGVLARIAEDAAANLARTSADRAGASSARQPVPDEAVASGGSSDVLDLADGAVPAHGAARLARTAPGLSGMSDGAATEARLKGGIASDQVTAGEAAPVPRPTVPARDDTPRPRAFDPARITSMPVREALRAIEHLSTEELHSVLDHESANRNRKTVLRAVEETLTTPAEADTPR